MKTYFAGSVVILMLGLMPTPNIATAEDVPTTGEHPSLVDGPKRIVRRVDPSRLKEGWRLTVKVPYTRLSESAVCELSVEDGWLRLRRQSDGGLEWQVVFAQVVEDTALEIAVVENQPAIEISYHEGRYFVKDTAHALRILRERKESDTPLFAPGECLSKIEPRGRAYFNLRTWRGNEGKGNDLTAGKLVGTTFSGWDDEEWFFVASGPSVEKIDCLVRLNPIERATTGYGFQSIHCGLTHAFHGEAWAFDDGELFVAYRMLPDSHRLQQQIERIRDTLPGSSPPAIHAAQWLNNDEEHSWNDLKGKVVLVDFWGTWCGPCVKKLPDVQALHKKYSDQGLVVIGVHTAQGAQACEPFIKERGIGFPIAVDTGETQKAFAVTSVPAYFVIDTEGKVVYGYSANPPSAELIESLLPK